MDRREQLEQQIWEFVYGLLPEDEAEAVRERITSDPDVARLYAEVKLQSELVAEATRLEVAPIPFPAPRDLETTAEPADLRPLPAVTPAAAERSAMRPVYWAVTLAATLLVGFVGYAYLKPRSPLRPVAFRSERAALEVTPVQATVLGPGRLQPRPANYLAVVTRSLSGQTRSARVAYRLFDESDELLAADQSQTDANGILQIETPSEIEAKFVRLEVEPLDGLAAAPLTHTFAVDRAELITHLNVDKPLCRPGETLRYRTVTLSRYDLRVRNEVRVQVAIEDADGNTLPGSLEEGLSERGVRHGEYRIPPDLPGGKYQVVARSPDAQFEEVRRSVSVRQYQSPRFRKRLEFARESYGPGDEVTARFFAERAAGGSLDRATLRVRAVVDGSTNFDQNLSTDEQGTAEVAFPLPPELTRGEGELTVTIADAEGTEVLRKPIPIHLGRVQVDFFPESGDLVAGIENRVYFRARDEEGKPVHVAGRVLDEMERVEAVVDTQRDGRGAFSIVPAETATYRLKIDTPADAGAEPLLPRANPVQFAVLHSAPSVFDAGADLSVEIRSTDCSRPLVLVAACRGAVVGQQIVTTERFTKHANDPEAGSCSIALPVAEHAEGVIRLTVYDLSVQPARPVAERLVYRRPRQSLKFALAGVQPRYAMGDDVDLTVEVQDETGRPQPAVLGLSVVDDALLSMADDHPARLTTQFWLTGQISDARELEDADFYLDPDQPEAAQALDLLLGTQGWRRLSSPGTEFTALADAQTDRYQGLGLPMTHQVVAAETATPIVLADNASEVRALAAKAVSTLRTARELDLRRIGLIVLLGGLIVLVATLILSLVLHGGGLRGWAPHLATASICLILGVFWVSAGIDTQGRLTWTHRTAPPMERQLAERSAVDEQPPAAEKQQAASPEEPAGKLGKQLTAEKTEPLRETGQSVAAGAEAPQDAIIAEANEPRSKVEGAYFSRHGVSEQESRELNRDKKERGGVSEVAEEEVAAAEMEEAIEADEAADLVISPLRRGGQAYGQADAEMPAPVPPAAEMPAPEPSAPAGPEPTIDAPRAMASQVPVPEEPAASASEPEAPAPGAVAGEPAPARPPQSGGLAGRTVHAPTAEAAPAAPAAPAATPDGLRASPLGARTMAASKPETFDKLAERKENVEAADDASVAKRKTEDTRRDLAERRMSDRQAGTELQTPFGGGFGGAGRPAGLSPADMPSKDDGQPSYEVRSREDVLADALVRRNDTPSTAVSPQNEQEALRLPQIVREYARWDAYALPAYAELGEPTDATAYWNPIAVADEQGRFQFRFTLPERETTYRISVDGHLDGRIGSDDEEIIARKVTP